MHVAEIDESPFPRLHQIHPPPSIRLLLLRPFFFCVSPCVFCVGCGKKWPSKIKCSEFGLIKKLIWGCEPLLGDAVAWNFCCPLHNTDFGVQLKRREFFDAKTPWNWASCRVHRSIGFYVLESWKHWKGMARRPTDHEFSTDCISYPMLCHFPWP